MPPRDTMEDDIFSQIEESTGDSFSPPDDAGSDEQVNPVETPSNKKEAQHEEDPDADGLQQPLKKDASKKEDPKAKKPEEAGKGALLGPDGKPIASGHDRRIFQQFKRAEAVVKDQATRIQGLERQLKESSALGGMPAQLGLDNEDTREALETAALLVKNPVEGARRAVEIALARGASLQEIVNDEFLPQLSLKATERMLNDRLGPIHKQVVGDQETQRITAEAQSEANQFLMDYPEAEVHLQDLAELVTEIKEKAKSKGQPIGNYMAAELALNNLRSFAMQSGLDFSQPIQDQIDARMNGGTTTQAPRNGGADAGGRQSPPRQQRPIPSGQRGDTGTPIRRTSRNDDSFDAIVRESMREAGMDI